ncbi:MAG TPA: hypothetical protein VFU46_08915 [Gemmatimonadales bacterium]|nr:hypothetical protein [Gemmatimonadales bacterium]
MTGPRALPALALLALGCSGGSLDSGWIGVPWKSTSAAPKFADSATTTALATAPAPRAPAAPGATPTKAKRGTTPQAGPAATPAPAGALAPGPAPEVSASRLQTALIRLRDLEGRHHRLTGSYSGHPSRLGLSTEPGVELRVVWASPWGWAALARDSANSLPACAIFVGTVPSSQSVDGRIGSARPGSPVCTAEGEFPPRMLNQVLTLAEDPPSADEAVVGLMRADLMNLATAQRKYRGVQGVYARNTKVLAVQYLWNSGVSLRILSANSSGWSGEATYDQLPGKSCVIFGGKVIDPPATEAGGRVPTREGVVECDR